MLRPLASKTKVILVVGVNGTGKTTTTAKLAHFLKKKGHSVMLAAADTFRAAAIEQLGIWAERIGCDIVQGPVQRRSGGGLLRRLSARGTAEHRVSDLRHRRPAAHQDEPHGRAREGEAHPRSARTPPRRTRPCSWSMPPPAATRSTRRANFTPRLPLTGVIVTKLDGSGKGGCVVAIQNELAHPHALHRHRRRP